MKRITKSSQETKNLGEEMARNAISGEVYLLFGELGAGKTSFTQGLAKGLGIKKRIISPTFVIMRSYPLGKGKTFNHVDLYRLEEGDIEGAGVLEATLDSSSITIVEWADRIKNKKFNKGYKIYFNYSGEDKREIKVEKING